MNFVFPKYRVRSAVEEQRQAEQAFEKGVDGICDRIERYQEDIRKMQAALEILESEQGRHIDEAMDAVFDHGYDDLPQAMRDRFRASCLSNPFREASAYLRRATEAEDDSEKNENSAAFLVSAHQAYEEGLEGIRARIEMYQGDVVKMAEAANTLAGTGSMSDKMDIVFDHGYDDLPQAMRERIGNPCLSDPFREATYCLKRAADAEIISNRLKEVYDATSA